MSATTHRFLISLSPNDNNSKHADGWLKPGLQRFGMLESGRLRPLRSQTNGQIALAGSRRTKSPWLDTSSVCFDGRPCLSLLIMAGEEGGSLHSCMHTNTASCLIRL